jgi:uncharacterized protein (TIGR02391 family)
MSAKTDYTATPPSVLPAAGIELLHRQIEKGEQLLATPPIEPGAYRAWENTTRAVLLKCFGSESENIRSVMNIGKTGPRPADPTAYWLEEHRIKSLADQLQMLGSCVEQLEMETERRSPEDASAEFAPDVSSLHPKVLRYCQVSFETGQFDNAIHDALKLVEEEIRSRIHASPDDVGVNLVSKAMNPKSPALVFSDVPAEQEAAHSLYRGALGALKNPRSHRFLDTSDRVRTLEILAFASLLMRMLDDAKPKGD